MAKPRIFISSTFYDLRHIRADINATITSLGYQAVRHETGQIPYDHEKDLEESAYNEVLSCDIFISIIGGRLGTESMDGSGYSITQKEILKAIENEMPIYFFIEKDVKNDYEIFKKNIGNKSINYRHDVKIYEFINSTVSAQSKNPVFGFENYSDISAVLIEQFSGYFHRLLADRKRTKEINAITELGSISQTLKDLVDNISHDRSEGNEAIRSIIMYSNPLFKRLANATSTPYRVFFVDRNEMKQWIEARGFEEEDKDNYFPDAGGGGYEEWKKTFRKKTRYIVFKRDFFDESGKTLNFSESEWDDGFIVVRDIDIPETPPEDDEIPF